MDINIDVLRTSMNVKNSLSRIKTLTGIPNWNIICRWAFCLSIKQTSLPREVEEKLDGVEIDYKQIEPGCLAFFGEKKITHVGILINNRSIIHAFGFVRIDIFNRKGIINSITKKITHKLKQIRKY